MIKLGAPKSYVASVSVLAVLASITTISGFVLSSSPSHAETSSVLASVTVPDVCTLRKDNSSTEHTATSKANAYISDIGETTINISCNDTNGFSIYAVGYSNDTVGNTNLIGETTSSTIPTGTSTDKSVSNWAMKLTAVSGTFTPTILNDFDSYHEVPSTATKVATRTGSIDLSANAQIKTTYAVALSAAQTKDTYTGKVKYTVVHPNYAKADGTLPYIQDFTLADCQAQASSSDFTIYDERDGNAYTVRYIANACWMTQNLRYLGDTGSSAGTMTIGNGNSNVANKSIALYSLDSSNAGNFGDYSSHCDSTNGYNYACVYDSGSTSTGVWYNYYIASGGTISTNSNTTEATSDICPAGWHLPSYENINSVESQISAFSPSTGGWYYNGSLSDIANGYWWSTGVRNGTNRYNLYYANNSLNLNGSNERYRGYFIRCVRAS